PVNTLYAPHARPRESRAAAAAAAAAAGRKQESIRKLVRRAVARQLGLGRGGRRSGQACEWRQGLRPPGCGGANREGRHGRGCVQRTVLGRERKEQLSKQSATSRAAAPSRPSRAERFISPMLPWWWTRCTAERLWCRKFFPCDYFYHSFSVLTASIQSDCSSGDEKLNCPSDNEQIRKQCRSLTSDSVVQTLRCLRRRPTVAFAYFKDTKSIGFHHDFSTYSEIIHILSHSGQGKMLLSLFCEIVSQAGTGGPEMLPLIDELRKTCATSYALSFAINCVIKAYTTCYDAQATIEMFMHLCRLGFVPSVWACNFLLKFVAHSGEMGMVVAAYDQMKSFQLTLDAHSLKIVTRSLFQENKAIEAYKVWLEICEMGVKPDAHGYLSFVSGLCDCGKYNLASLFLEDITRERVPIEAVAYNIVIDRLCKQMKLEDAENVLENITKRGFTPDAYGYSCLIRSYCKMGNLGKALDHCEAMEYRGVKINCHIAGYLLQSMRKLGLTSEVTVHFKNFRDLGLHLDGVLYNIAMDAYCKLGNMNEAVKLMDEMVAEGLSPDKIHYTCLINGYCLKGEILNALLTFDKMLKENIKPDTVIYNILASGFCRSGVVSEVFDVLDHMMDQGLEPDSVTCGVVIDGFCRGGYLREALVLFNRAEVRGINNIEVLYSAMVCGYLNLGCTDHAFMLFRRVAEQGNLVDHLSCSKLINNLCRDGNVKGASYVFSMMLEKNVVPDKISYSNLISGYCQIGDMDNAHLWFRNMVEKGLEVDVIVYTTLMNGYCRASRLQEAHTLFVQMTNAGIKPDVIAYTVLLDGELKETLQQGWQGIDKERSCSLLIAKHKKLLSYMEDKKIEPDVPCYTVLIDGQCKAKYLEEAQGLFDEMLKKGLTPDVYTYTALINGYCSEGEIAKAKYLLQKMRDKGMKPDALTFSVLQYGKLRSQKLIALYMKFPVPVISKVVLGDSQTWSMGRLAGCLSFHGTGILDAWETLQEKINDYQWDRIHAVLMKPAAAAAATPRSHGSTLCLRLAVCYQKRNSTQRFAIGAEADLDLFGSSHCQ
ncbi:hypothetical protein EJB05_02823, partial [Eragrostis curvula]